MEDAPRILVVVPRTMEFARKQGYCNIGFVIEKAACFSKLSEISSIILVVMSKTMEFAHKLG